MTNISVVLTSYNEEKNIKDCLRSVEELATETIVVDGSSTDKTAAIARQLKAKVFIVSNKIMFHRNKQLALEKARGDWILQLDADERVTPKLQEEIQSIIPALPAGRHHPSSIINGYYIPRKNYFLGKFLSKGGQYPDYVIRLVRRGKAYFPCKSVHEQIKVDGSIGYLKNPLIHLSSPTLSGYLKNANRYTTLTAQELMKNNIPLNFFNQWNYLFFLPMKTFIKIYFRHKGFLDGFPGFLFALFSGLHYSIAFLKYWEKKKNKADFNIDNDWN